MSVLDRAMDRVAERLQRKSRAYKRLFADAAAGPHTDAAIVLADLRKFCHHNASTLKVSPVTRTVDPLATVMAEGRREAFLRINGFLQFDERQLDKMINNDERDEQ